MTETQVRRAPTIESALQKIESSGVLVNSVVDIGVLTGTSSLQHAFPNAKHHLFEPVDIFFDTIRASYKNFDYELHQLAVSSASGTAFQIGVSADDSSKFTHSYVSDQFELVGATTDQGIVIECKPVKKVTLDEFFSGTSSSGGWLVKIDVDGHEMPIIRGGESFLRGVDVIIVEATMNTLLERANAIAALGFQLIEIVDCCYYYDLLSQVDLIFVNRRVLQQCPDLHPWGSKPFSFDRWQTYSPPLA